MTLSVKKESDAASPWQTSRYISPAASEQAYSNFVTGPVWLKIEAGRGIDQHAGAQAGLVLEAPDHVAVGLGEDLPVDQVGRVALDVIAVLGELDRGAEIGRAVQALDAALHRPARGNAEAANLVRHAGREILR